MDASQTVETEGVRIALTAPQAVDETSGMLVRPARPTGAGFVLAHGAGTDRSHPFLRAVARGLAGRGHPVLAFNFAYAEAGRRRPDPMPHLESAYRDAAAYARTVFGSRPLVLAGRSMGGRVGSHLAAQGEPCDGLAFFAYPLHPAGRPERLRTGHWPDLAVPILFVSGDRDSLCDLELLERERAAHLRRADDQMAVVAGADHSFRIRARDAAGRRDVLDEIVEAVTDWARDAVPPGTAS